MSRLRAVLVTALFWLCFGLVVVWSPPTEPASKPD